VVIVTGSASGHSDDVSVQNFDLRGSLSIVTGRGNDFVFVSNETDGELDGPDDDDIFGNVVISTGAGNDDVDLGCGGRPAVGASEVTDCPNLDIIGNLVVSLGTGNDFLGAEDVFVFQDINGAQGNATIDAGSGNDDVEISDSSIDTIFTIAMGAGNDFLSIFGSGGGTPIATLIADGGPGRDEFENDLGITHNGVQDFDPLGVPHEIIKNFEIFDAVPTATDAPKGKKGW
jgi:hypothetical protein